MAEQNPSATKPVTPNTQQHFVSITNTPHVYKSSSQVDVKGEGLPKPGLRTARLERFLKEEMLNSEINNTRGLLELAFPKSCLPLSVADAVKLLLERGILANNDEGKPAWTTDITPLETHHQTNGRNPEAHLQDFLNGISAVLLGSRPENELRRWSTVATTVPLPGGPADRKPDLVLTSEPKNKNISWENIHSTLQLKKDDTAPLCIGNAERLSSDAFMAFSSQNTRRFFLGTSICGYTVRIYVYHRSGRVSSVPFSIHDDPHSLVHLLIGLMMCPTNTLGLDPSFVWTGSYFLVTIKGVVYRLLECVFRSKTIRGRGTTCWRAVKHDDLDGPEYAIKDTWTDTSRTPETKLMETLKDVEGIPTLVAAQMLNHEDGRDVTSHWRKNIKKEKAETNNRKKKSKKQERTVEDRQHWILVTTPFAQPLSSFSSKKELLSAVIDAIRAHKGMLLKNVLHRDISLENIMIYDPAATKKTDSASQTTAPPEKSPSSSSSGLKKGLLIDVDYGVVRSKGSGNRMTAIGHRTGTLPFMAIEVVRGQTTGHGVHHDLESMFYVLVWICIFYRGPNNSPRFRPVDTDTAAWTGILDVSMVIVGLTKKATFKHVEDFDEYIKANAATYFYNLIPCLRELQPLFFDRAAPVTHEKMIEILERHQNELPEVDDWVDDELEKPILTKKRGRNVSPERPPIKGMRTYGSTTNSRGGIDGTSGEDDDDEEEGGASSSEESDDEERDPGTYRRKTAAGFLVDPKQYTISQRASALATVGYVCAALTAS